MAIAEGLAGRTSTWWTTGEVAISLAMPVRSRSWSVKATLPPLVVRGSTVTA